MIGRAKFVGAMSTVLVATSVLAIGATAAYASKPTVSPGPGDSVTCSFGAKVKLSPPLKNDWNPSDHSSDPDQHVRDLPYTTYAAASQVSVAAKGKAISCSGTVAGHAVTGVKVTASALTGSPPFHADCAGLASPAPGTTFQSILSWKLDGALMSGNSTVTSSLATLIDAHGVGFELSSDPSHAGTSISGAFAGGTSDSKAYVDANTFSVLANSSHASSTSPSAPTVCEPSLKIKKAGTAAETAQSKSPKGFKKITIGPGVFDGSPSTLTIGS
jgi:hypothetical protein